MTLLEIDELHSQWHTVVFPVFTVDLVVIFTVPYLHSANPAAIVGDVRLDLSGMGVGHDYANLQEEHFPEPFQFEDDNIEL